MWCHQTKRIGYALLSPFTVTPRTNSSLIRKLALAAGTIVGKFAARKSREERPSHRAPGRIEGSIVAEAAVARFAFKVRAALARPAVCPLLHAAGRRVK